MCGIAGGLFGDVPADRAADAVARMRDAMRHRGPDGDGLWIRPDRNPVVALAHRRLAIIDLSPGGAQPMAGTHTWITYNGEIFNYRELRDGTPGADWKTQSDTEVLLAGWEARGSASLQDLDGMFAFGLWDESAQELVLARDRLGIKPLYYARVGKSILFASEIGALLASGLVSRRIDHVSLAHYLAYQTVPAPRTLLRDVAVVPPAHVLRATAAGDVVIAPYWTLLAPDVGSEAPAGGAVVPALQALLRAAVRRHVVSDVPVGLFLSGGIDSSALVSLMHTEGLRANTFAIGFDDGRYDETNHARHVAAHFGTAHTDIRLSESDLLDALPGALAALDHPSGDGINTWVISRAVRDAGLKVALSGLGGDELFGGYPSFRRLGGSAAVARTWGRVPTGARAAVASVTRAVLPDTVAGAKLAAATATDGSLERLWPLTRQLLDARARGGLLAGDDPLAQDDGDPYVRSLGRAFAAAPAAPSWSKISYAEMRGYMHDVLLRDTDQMSMSHGLEVRVPLLDHHLVRFVMALPDRVKYGDGGPKALLTGSLPERLPEAVVDRPKQGFTLPFDPWMRGALESFCEHQLGPGGLDGRGVFRPGAVVRLWRRFQAADPGVPWSHVWMLVALNGWMAAHQVDTVAA